MSLTNSNSIAEIRCKKKVMGLRMTEEIRKLAMFFLKKYPYDIQNVYTKPPPRMEYYGKRFSAIIGGVPKTT